MSKIKSFFLPLFFFIFIGLFQSTSVMAEVWTIAIDPGHGGKDPGALGHYFKFNEKDITLSVSKELKTLLDKDPNFKAVLTRKGDYYISVPSRSEIARKYKANYLISIHADSAKNKNARGVSIWVLSNGRAKSEMGRWLEDHEKRSELLGGAGSVLSSHNEKYLNKTVLDLQFRHSQTVGYELGSILLRRFKKITKLRKNKPQHASLGVLRSPDIPSILVETGYISNKYEEQKLHSLTYRKKIARIIYDGLVEYRQQQIALEMKNNTTPSRHGSLVDSGIRHKVVKGDTLSGIARKYHIPMSELRHFNHLNRSQVWLNETLKIPTYKNTQHIVKQKPVVVTNHRKKEDIFSILKHKNESTNLPKYHLVTKGQTVYSIARQYKLPVQKLFSLNPKTKSGKIIIGQKIRLH